MLFNKIIHRIFFKAMCLISLLSCKPQIDCEKVNLTEDERAWFQKYVNNDTIFYKDAKNNEVDTFIVNAENKLAYTTCNEFELGPFIYEIGSLAFDNIDNYSINKFRKRYSLGFDKIGQLKEQDCKKSIRFFDLSTNNILDFKEKPKEEFVFSKDSIKIEVLVFTKDKNCFKKEGGEPIMQEFAISKEFGLIWYKTVNGDLYKRI